MSRTLPVALAAVVMLCLPAGAQEQDRGAWFQSLKQPGSNLSCCDISDCRQTKAEWREGQWFAMVEEKWMPVPPERVLLKPHSIDGEAYVCNTASRPAGEDYSPGIGIVPVGPSTASILCFIPPTMGF